MSVAWAAALVWMRFGVGEAAGRKLRLAAATVLALILAAHAYGTHQRNEVWSSAESLWLDVTVKSPGNGRGLMNYGLTQMAQGRYDVALDYYERALETFPRYPYLHVNLGIVKGAMGRPVEAERHFNDAIGYGRNDPAVYYYYARWLHENDRNDEALGLLERGAELSPNHTQIALLLDRVRVQVLDEGELDVATLARVAEADPSPALYHRLEPPPTTGRASTKSVSMRAKRRSRSIPALRSPTTTCAAPTSSSVSSLERSRRATRRLASHPTTSSRSRIWRGRSRISPADLRNPAARLYEPAYLNF